MTNHETFPKYWSGDWRTSPSKPPDQVALARMKPTSIVRLVLALGEEENYFSMIGCNHMDPDAAQALYEDLCRRFRESRSELIARARNHRMQSQLNITSWEDPRRDELEEAIRSRLDLPTFIARHAGMTAVGFLRMDDVLVCPCPMPRDTGVDSWLYVDPAEQTWSCTNCMMAGDIFAFASWFFDLRHAALFNFLAIEAGLSPILLTDESGNPEA